MKKPQQKQGKRSKHRQYIISKLYEMDLNEHFIFSKSEIAFVKTTINGILEHKETIDQALTDNLINWRLSRLSYVDRAILRLATYEMMYTETPIEIIIDEALNLTHLFSDEGDRKHVSFNNSVLENLAKFLKKKV